MNDLNTESSLPNSSESLLSSVEQSVAGHQQARLRRVLDYQAASLAKENVLEANLGSLNCGLIRIALWLDETIEQAVGSGPRTIERLQKVLPAIDAHLRVTRQIDRFAQIEIRAAETRPPKKIGGASDSDSALPAPSPPDESEEIEV